MLLNTSMMVVNLIGIGITLWALIDCVFRPAGAFPAIDRQTKSAWLIFLGLALIVEWIFPVVSLLGVAAIVISVFYLVDVRTKVASLTRR